MSTWSSIQCMTYIFDLKLYSVFVRVYLVLLAIENRECAILTTVLPSPTDEASLLSG